MKGKVVKFIKNLLINRKRAALVVIIILIAGYYFWNKGRSNDNEPVTQTATVEKGTIVSSVTASGTIISSNIENVTTQASGTVKKVYVSDGDTVSVGQKLAEIDLDVQGEQNYASAYSSFVGAQTSLNSAKNALELANASLDVTYDEIQGHDEDEDFETKETRIRAEVSQRNAVDGVTSANARYYSASLSLKTSSPTITAPVAGTIKSVTIAEGMNIGASETASGARANQRIATIETQGLPIATFNVSEIDVTSITTGQKATITLDSVTDKTFTGKVVSVDRVGSVTNNVTTYPVIIQLDINSEEILPNMAATANIIIETKSDILMIPTSAISYQADVATVKVMQSGQEVTQNIEIGISNDTQSEVISGLSEGDTIVSGTTTTSTQQNSSEPGGFFPGAGMRIR